MVNLVVHIHLSAIVAARLALLDATFRGAPEAQERWRAPTIVLLAVGAGVLSLLMR